MSQGYIGVSKNAEARFTQHFKRTQNRHFKFAIEKYGWDNLVKTQILIADEDYLGFGMTGEISATVAENLDKLILKGPVMRLAVPNVPIPYSRPLEQFVIPQVGSIVEAVEKLMLTSVAHAEIA